MSSSGQSDRVVILRTSAQAKEEQKKEKFNRCPECNKVSFVGKTEGCFILKFGIFPYPYTRVTHTCRDCGCIWEVNHY